MDNNELIRSLARRRMVELQEEIAGLNALLSDFGEGRKRREVREVSTAPDAEPKARGRKPMSAAQRKAISVRMRKMWAGRRKG